MGRCSCPDDLPLDTRIMSFEEFSTSVGVVPLLGVEARDDSTSDRSVANDEAIELLRSDSFATCKHIRICGLMGIATNTDNERQIKDEYYELKIFYDGIKQSYFRKDDSFNVLSMGMSTDYKLAIEMGSNMIRVGSTIFGGRAVKFWKNN